MRIKQIRKWIIEGGSLPQDLTQKEKEHLTKLGWDFTRDWHTNEQKWWEHHFLHGKMHGKQEGWYENGQKKYEEDYLHGKRHGKQERRRSNGQKEWEWHYLHGMKHGVFKQWNRDGNLLLDEEYFYGNRIK